MLDDRVWMMAVSDRETGIIIQATFEADSEIEARQKIKLTIERMFLGTQRIDFDRVPEAISPMISSMHRMVESMEIGGQAGYHIGGHDDEL